MQFSPNILDNMRHVLSTFLGAVLIVAAIQSHFTHGTAWADIAIACTAGSALIFLVGPKKD